MSEHAANERKKMVDGLASVLLQIDERGILRMAREAAKTIQEAVSHPRVVVCGGAGANKTTFASVLSTELDVPCFDFDHYIPGGYTEDKRLYAQRLAAGIERLWEDLPQVPAWIVEHVEACNRDLVHMLSPNLAIHLDPGMEHLKSVAQARDLIGTNTNGQRAVRASETAIRSRSHFQRLPGPVILRREGLIVRHLTEA